MKAFGLFVILFYSYIGIVFGSILIGNPGRRQASFDRFDGTCRGHKVPLIFNYYGVKTEGNKLWLNSTITAKEDITEDLMMSMRIQRCKNRENLDTCEEFHNYRSDKFCTKLESDSDLWSPFFATFTPKYKCPIKKGVYHGINSVFDVSAFLLFPLDNWFWKVKVDVNEQGTDRLIMCVVVEAHVIVNKAAAGTNAGLNVEVLGQKIG